MKEYHISSLPRQTQVYLYGKHLERLLDHLAHIEDIKKFLKEEIRDVRKSLHALEAPSR
jgi:hypothetical protein